VQMTALVAVGGDTVPGVEFQAASDTHAGMNL